MATEKNRFLALGLAALMGLTTISGCSALGIGDDDNDDDIRVSRRDRDSDRYDRDDAVLSGDRDVDVAGSTATKVPKDARVVDSGSGSLSYTARDDGSVYLYDEDARTVVWDARVREGDRVNVGADDNRIEVNGRSATNIDLKSEHNFRLYFLEGLKSTRTRDRDRDRF